MTYRYLGMLIDGLPPESLTKTKLRAAYSDVELAAMAADNTEHGPWSHTDLLLAALWDLIAGLMHDSKKGDPPQYPRPGITEAIGGRRGRMTPAQMRDYEQRIRRTD